MSLIIPEDRRRGITMAVSAAYQTAGLEVDAMERAVAPLQQLIAAQPLVVSEVPKLTHQRAATHLAAHAGRAIIEDGNAAERLAGLLYANAAGGWILVDQEDLLARRRFSVAHELGHYFLHFLPLLEQASAFQSEDVFDFNEELPAPSDIEKDPNVGHIDASSLPEGVLAEVSSLDQWEAEANYFAAEILMPEATCRIFAQRYASRYGNKRQVLARRLTTEFLVSQAAMLRRLEELHIA